MTIDPYWANVVLALPMEGVNNSTTFTDYSPTPKTITRNGDTKILTAQSKWGQGSGYFDGTGDYLTSPNSADFLFGSGSFTVESWIYPTALPAAGNAGCIASVYDTINNKRSWTFNVFNDGGVFKLQLFVSTNGLSAGVTAFLGTGLSLNQWQHVAASRDSNTMRLFISGTTVVETSYSSALYNSDVVLGIGRYAIDSAIYTGYQQDLRITKGVARYTADFTPPAEPMFINRGAISGTVYEKNQSGVYVPGAYPVRIYKRSDGSLVASTTSAADGSYAIANLPVLDSSYDPIEYYAVALDTAATWQSPGLAEQVFPS